MSALKSDSRAIVTYVESDAGVDLEPTPNAKLLFRALLFHGPGFDEQLRFFVGPSTCGSYDVLWCNSDWVEDRDMSADAWLPRNILTGPALWEALLLGYWGAEKTAYNLDGPNFNEVVTDERGALSAEEVWDLVERIWPSDETN